LVGCLFVLETCTTDVVYSLKPYPHNSNNVEATFHFVEAFDIVAVVWTGLYQLQSVAQPGAQGC